MEKLTGHLMPGAPSMLTSLIAGALLGFSYPPYGFSVFAWIALVPLLVSVNQDGTRGAFIRAWIFYLACFAVAFSWPMAHVRTDTAVISASAWLALTLFMAIPFGVAGAFAARFPGIRTHWFAALGILVWEIVLRSGPIPMPWTSLAYSQSGVNALVRAASVTGSEGVASGIILVNVLLASALVGKRSELVRRIATAISIPALLFGTNLAFRSPHPTDSLRVAILQPGLDPLAWSNVTDRSRVDSLIAYSTVEKLVTGENTDLVIWPETALPITSLENGDSEMLRKILRWTDAQSMALLSGAITSDQEGKADDRQYYNSALLFQADGSIQRVDKHHLVPFAEYVPFSNHLKMLGKLAVPAGGVAGYLPGTGSSVLQLPSAILGVMICFESAFSGYATDLVENGSQFLVVMTQDGWWRSRIPAIQHFQMARFRASEQGRAVVQVSVDGLSGLIDADGEVAYQTEPDVRARSVFDVPMYDHISFYRRYGSMLNNFVLGIWMVLVGFHGLRLFRKESKESNEPFS